MINVIAAQAYAERHGLHALIVQRGDEVLTEAYGGGYNASKAHSLYSGTKSFWGVAAVAAEADAILDLDEPVSRTFPSWSEGRKAFVTLRRLLNLTSGIGFGGLGTAVPTYERALAVQLKDEPGGKFTYGGIPLQVFGAVLARKLGARSPHDYLRERIFEPIGLQVGWWRTLADGAQPLPTGASLTAREWLKFGLLVRERGRREKQTIVPESALAECFIGSEANPRYGLCWWLSPLAAVPDIVYASGSGGQALYVIPSEGVVAVKFGGSSSYKHEAFLKRLCSLA